MVLKTIDEAKSAIREYFGKNELKQAVFYSSDELEDAIDEIADSSVDIYTSDLLEWVAQGDNLGWVDAYTDEYGDVPQNSSGGDTIIRLIQGAEYLKNRELLDKAVGELHDELPEGYAG